MLIFSIYFVLDTIKKMSNVEVAKDKAARLLKKRASISSAASSEFAQRHKKQGYVF